MTTHANNTQPYLCMTTHTLQQKTGGRLGHGAADGRLHFRAVRGGGDPIYGILHGLGREQEAQDVKLFSFGWVGGVV